MEVKKLIVENKDFREMMTVYNELRFLLYLDNPYLEGERLIGSVSKLMISGTSRKKSTNILGLICSTSQ